MSQFYHPNNVQQRQRLYSPRHSISANFANQRNVMALSQIHPMQQRNVQRRGVHQSFVQQPSQNTQAEINSLRKQLADQKSYVKHLRNDNIKLKEQNATLKKDNDNIQHLTNENAMFQTEIVQLSQQNVEYEHTVEKQKNEIDLYDQMLLDQNNNYDAGQNQEQITEDKDQLEPNQNSEVQALVEKICQLEQHTKEQDEQLQAFQEELQARDMDFQQKEDEVQALNEELLRLEQKPDEEFQIRNTKLEEKLMEISEQVNNGDDKSGSECRVIYELVKSQVDEVFRYQKDISVLYQELEMARNNFGQQNENNDEDDQIEQECEEEMNNHADDEADQLIAKIDNMQQMIDGANIDNEQDLFDQIKDRIVNEVNDHDC